MNGRCTTDPLDTADDICEFCGNAFCSSCLIDVGKRGHGPVCRSCAVANSGIRGSRPSTPRPSRAALKAARAELALLNENRPAPIFEFFDTVLEPEELAALHASQSGSAVEPDPTDASDSDATPTLGSAVPSLSAALGKLKSKRRARRATDTPLIDDIEDDADADPLQSLSHLLDDQTLAADTALSEVAALESHEQPPPPVRSGPVPAPSHFSAPTVVSASVDADAASEAPPPGPFNVHHDPFELADQPFDPSIDPFAPVSVPSQPQPGSPESASHFPTSADRDSAGNWVPPMLRGIDPEAEAAGTHLPKRRRETD